MNTQTEWKTTARVSNPERKIFWESVFSNDRVPIVSFVPQMAVLPGFNEPQKIYMLDLKAITDECRQRLVQAIAKKFGIPASEVARDLDSHGVPILASDVSVMSTDRLLMSAIL
jgi:hypothetical protein